MKGTSSYHSSRSDAGKTNGYADNLRTFKHYPINRWPISHSQTKRVNIILTKKIKA